MQNQTFSKQGFPVNFVKFIRTSFLIEHLRWPLRCQTYLHILDFKLNHNKAFDFRFSEKITDLVSYVSNELFVVFGLLLTNLQKKLE